jgi:hypothetical protein
MSRAGRRARRERLIAAGLWEPSTVLAESERTPDDSRTRALLADRDAWIREAGVLGWQREMNRRRASRLAAARSARKVRMGA